MAAKMRGTSGSRKDRKYCGNGKREAVSFTQPAFVAITFEADRNVLQATIVVQYLLSFIQKRQTQL